MRRIVLLDSGPLGMAARRRGSGEVEHCHALLASIQSRAIEILIPEIADYEVRRELVRLGLREPASKGIPRLDAFCRRFGNAPVTIGALRAAADFWARVRYLGNPTADDRDLDADAILAGVGVEMARSGAAVTIATGNHRHFDRFDGIKARSLESIAASVGEPDADDKP